MPMQAARLERVEGLHAPFQKLVAFAVALELDLEIARESGRACVGIDLHGVVNDRSTGTSGSNDLGFLPRRATADASRQDRRAAARP